MSMRPADAPHTSMSMAESGEGVCVAAGRVHRVAATASGFAPGHVPIRRCLIRVASPAKGPSPTAYAETIGSIAAGNSPSDER
jgi:hypothetical protein